MFALFIITYVGFLVLVNTHPLIQNLQPYPVTNYQQNVYRPPYSEAFVVQPSNINHYPQQISIQTPVSTYQTLQLPALTEPSSQMYWDKVWSNPSVPRMFDPNNIIFNQYGKEVQSNLHPYNTGRVVNNYIIVPPEYLTINETVLKKPKTNHVRNGLKDPVQENVPAKRKKKKVLSNKKVKIQKDQPDNKIPRKRKDKPDESWNFSTDNIKCFTPADVLENEKYLPERKVVKNEKARKQRQREISNNLQSIDKIKNESRKSRKTLKNKIKNKTIENESKECNKKTKNISSYTTMPQGTKKCKKASKMSECPGKNELSNCKTKIVEDVPQFCDEIMSDFSFLNLFHQDNSNLDNRHTRNSKPEPVTKDSRGVYPDLSGDTPKSLDWNVNDFFSQPSLQKVPTSNLYLGQFPFDITQIYQIPQYSNMDVNKSKGNTDKNKTTRRKRKKKKNSNRKTKIENSGNNDFTNGQTPEINYQLPENNTQTPEINSQIQNSSFELQETCTQASKILTNIPKLRNETKLDKVVSLSNETNTIEIPVSVDEIPTEDDSLQYFKEPESIEKIPEENDSTIHDYNKKRKQEMPSDIYETQIPILVVKQTNNKNDIKISEYEEVMINELQPTSDTDVLNQLSESEYEIFNMIMNDYYPDFRADNHAYLVSDEEIDVHNTHDRYFYVTDKSIDSKEMFSLEQESQFSNKKNIYTEDELQNYNAFERINDRNIATGNDKSQEIVYRTPPGLEVPDFITRKVNKDRYDSTEVYYQHNNFAEDFGDNSDSFIETAKGTDDNNPEHLVETVYARSKVVKYGHEEEINKSSKPETTTNFPKLEDGVISKDGDKTIVIAKSLGSEDYW